MAEYSTAFWSIVKALNGSGISLLRSDLPPDSLTAELVHRLPFPFHLPTTYFINEFVLMASQQPRNHSLLSRSSHGALVLTLLGK